MSNDIWPTHNLAVATVESMKKWERKAADFYPTPEDVTQALVDVLGLPAGTKVREPACGDGKMARVLKLAGLDVTASDLHNRGYGEPYQDFFKAPTVAGCTWTISNPPFETAEAFIRQALAQTPNVAMLLKSNYWHAGRCIDLFESHRPTVEYKLTWRPAFLEEERGSNPLMDVSWLVWRAAQGGQATWRPLRRPKKAPKLRPLLEPQLVNLADAFEEAAFVRRVR